MLYSKKILVIEEEFLIALDIQRILEAAGAEQTVFARSVSEAMALEGRWTEFDLVVVEFNFGNLSAMALIAAVRHIGVPVAITSSALDYRYGVPGLIGVPVVLKPFVENDLIAACHAALNVPARH
jgi:DNA-binding response OmpR family regulator